MPANNGAADPIRRAIAEQVDQWSVSDRAVRADADDAVHQMRVTIRRIRSLLRAAPGGSARLDGGEAKLGPPHEPVAVGGAAVGSLDSELRWLAGLLGTARDAEVLAQRYRRALDRMAPPLVRGRVFERLVDAAAARYRAGWAESLTAMDSPRYRRLVAGLGGLVDEAAGPPSGNGAPDTDTVQAAYRRVRKAAKAARVGGAGRDGSGQDDAAQDDALHRIRKAAKRLRYTAAALDRPSIAAQAKTIQTLLGEHQDSVVSQAHLLAEADAATAAGEDTFTYGLLYQQEREITRSCHAQLGGALNALAAAVAALRGGRVGL